MKVCIISGRYPATKFNSSVNHKIYADVHGYDYIHCNWPTKSKNTYLNKIEYVLHYFNNYDFIVWIDDDAFFYDFSIDIMKYRPTENEFLSACKSPTFKSLKTFLSSGQFILKCNELAYKFLIEVKSQDLKVVKDWWKEELGYFSNGDQDSMIYLLLTKIEYKDKFKLYDYAKFNSRVENLIDTDLHTPLILHFTGKPYLKQENYELIQKTKKLHSSLVPKDLLKDYNIKKFSSRKSTTEFFFSKLGNVLRSKKK